jgi:DHA1 family multidrug resistance protein-like MFS transporter
MVSNFIIAQCMLIYLPFTYPKYASSLFAANGLSRALLAAAAILFSIPLFENLGVTNGVTLLAGLCCGCCVGIYVLYFYGATLRKRSKFADT